MASPHCLRSSFVLMLSVLMLFASSKSTPFSSSSVASGQYEFWSANVRSNMPNAILSKLSPLPLNDSQYFTSLTSKTSFVFDVNFCAVANLACVPNLHNNKAMLSNYNPPVKMYFTPPRIIRNSTSRSRIASSSQVDTFSFFRLSVLRKGNKVHLPDLQTSWPSRAFLPYQLASKISLSFDELKRVFPESFLSPITDESIQMSLAYCLAPPLEGEIMSCPKSLEEMVGFAKNVLGQKHLLSLTSKSTNGSGKELIIGNIKEYRDAKKIVSCHEVFLPFATYFCHLISSTSLYAVDLLEPETKVPVNRVIAVCHMDTSKWDKHHAAFKILKISPGKGEACHWFSEVDLAWISA